MTSSCVRWSYSLSTSLVLHPCPSSPHDKFYRDACPRNYRLARQHRVVKDNAFAHDFSITRPRTGEQQWTSVQAGHTLIPAPRNSTLRGMIVHAMHDEAGHQGEIHLLKKLADSPDLALVQEYGNPDDTPIRRIAASTGLA